MIEVTGFWSYVELIGGCLIFFMLGVMVTKLIDSIK
jgi:hypothetical protein